MDNLSFLIFLLFHEIHSLGDPFTRPFEADYSLTPSLTSLRLPREKGADPGSIDSQPTSAVTACGRDGGPYAQLMQSPRFDKAKKMPADEREGGLGTNRPYDGLRIKYL